MFKWHRTILIFLESSWPDRYSQMWIYIEGQTCRRSCLPWTSLPRLIPWKLTCLLSSALRFSIASWILFCLWLSGSLMLRKCVSFLLCIPVISGDQSLSLCCLTCCWVRHIHNPQLASTFMSSSPALDCLFFIDLDLLSIKWEWTKSTATPAIILPDSTCHIDGSFRDFVKGYFCDFACHALFLLRDPLLNSTSHNSFFPVCCIWVHKPPITGTDILGLRLLIISSEEFRWTFSCPIHLAVHHQRNKQKRQSFSDTPRLCVRDKCCQNVIYCCMKFLQHDTVLEEKMQKLQK